MNYFLCSQCHNQQEEDVNMDLIHTREKTQPIKVKAIKMTGSMLHNEQNTQTVNCTNDIDMSNTEQSEFNIIDYPYEETPFSMTKPNVNSHLNNGIPLSFIPKISSNINNDNVNDLDYTLIDDYSDVDKKSNHSVAEKKYCIYCEEIYKDAYRNGYILKEKPCIYCNRMISKETLEELIKNGFMKEEKKNNKMMKAKSVSRMNIVKNENNKTKETKIAKLPVFNTTDKKKSKIEKILNNNKGVKTIQKPNLLNTKLMRMKTQGIFRVQKKI